MSTTEFRAWVKTLDAHERSHWRGYRRKLSQDRAERKRLAALRDTPKASPPLETEILAPILSAEETEAVRAYLASGEEIGWAFFERAIAAAKSKGKSMKLSKEEVALLPPDIAVAIRRQRRREAVKKWREQNAEKHRQAAREQWKRIQADPERHAAYLQKKAEAQRQRRAEAKRDDE